MFGRRRAGEGGRPSPPHRTFHPKLRPIHTNLLHFRLLKKVTKIEREIKKGIIGLETPLICPLFNLLGDTLLNMYCPVISDYVAGKEN